MLAIISTMNIREQISYVFFGFLLSFIICPTNLCRFDKIAVRRIIQQENTENNVFHNANISKIGTSISVLTEFSNTASEEHGSATSGTIFNMKTKKRHFFPETTVQNTTSFSRDSYPSCSKWAVITSIFLPTRLIKTLIRLNDWCTVVVADLKSPPESEFFNGLDNYLPHICLVYLTVEKQHKLEYSIIQHLPYNSFGRKNIGFIFAIHHGAKIIYDTDDDNEIKDIDLFQFWSSRESTKINSSILKWYSTGANPYHVLGGSHVNIWPRGFPLDKITQSSAVSLKWAPNARSPDNVNKCIVQSLADQEPDVDAIFRLTSLHYPVFLSPRTRFTAALLNDDDFAPYNAQATIFFESAFNNMLLPITVHGRVSDIWRGYIAQSIKEDKCSLIFTAPWVTQVRNAHNYMMDFNAEIPLYQQSSALIDFLKNNSFSSQTEAITAMFEYGLLEETDIHLSQAWQSDVNRARLSSITSTSKNEHLEPYNTSFRHLLILMGRGEHLRNWKNIILASHDLVHVDVILGVYDESVYSLQCTDHDARRVLCISVAGTTWTVGRNKLVQSAFAHEREHSVSYSFWTFGDADIYLHCPELIVPDPVDCFRKYDSLLTTFPQEVTAVAVIGSGHWPVVKNSVMVNIQAMDAAWNSFRREVVHVLFPYNPALDSNTWWSSQAIFWNKLQCLAPLFVTVPLTIFYGNPEHNDYPKNTRDFEAENEVRIQIMKGMAGILPRAPTDYPLQFSQDKVRELPLTTLPALSNIYELCVKEFSKDFHSFVLDY